MTAPHQLAILRFLCLHFTETGPTFTLSTLDGTLIALTVVGNYAYVTAAGWDMVYKVDINSGSSEILVEGLSSPEDIEYVPMAMEPPTSR